MIKIAITALVTATLVAAPAHADSADDQFVSSLNAVGMPGNRGTEIGIAHETCDLLNIPRIAWGGQPPFVAAMHHIRDELLAQGINPGSQMVAFKNATRDAYCPNLDTVFTG